MAPLDSIAGPDQDKPRIAVLTSLRFLAAALVVQGHAAQTDLFFKWLVPGIDYRQAVSFFFVLSGFILYWVDSTRAGSPQGLWRFYVARFARIWPMHLVAFVLVTLYVAPHFLVTGLVSAILNLSLLHAIIPIGQYYGSYNDVSWSLSDEIYFYAAFPLLVMLVRRSRVLALVLFAALTAAIVVATARLDVPPQPLKTAVTILGIIYINPFTRVFEFVLGMVCAHWIHARSKAPVKARIGTLLGVEVAATVVCIGWMWECARATTLMEPGAYSMWLSVCGPALGFAVLISALTWSHFRGRGPLLRVLSIRPLVYLGEISYTLYILHKIVPRVIASYPAIDAWLLEVPSRMGLYVLYWVATIAACALAHHLIENPARSLINRTLAPPRRRIETTDWFSDEPGRSPGQPGANQAW